jgi:multidrug efflux pump subunit AcrA (membrane-fusion protein)
LLLAIAIGGALVAAWRFLGATARPLSVHTVVPAPASVHRWFDTYGTVRGIGAVELTATHGGRVVDVRPAGARFDAGAALVVFDGGRRVLAELRHVEERLAYYEKRREEMRAKHDRPEARQAEIKIAEKRRLIAAARAKLDEHAVVATTSGQVVAPLVSPGDDVAPGEAVLRIDGQQLQAVFDLSPEDAQRARALTFCRAELEGQGEVDCELANDGPEAGPVTVVLPSDAQPHPGQRVRLARARFDGVFTVPASAVVQVGRSERIFVAAPTGRAEARAVAVADRGPHDAIVTQGLDVGDAVIVDAPRSLRPNAPVAARAIAGPR